MPKANSSSKGPRNRYASLQPRVKTLKETTIRKKWNKLHIATQTKVAHLFRTVERPALTKGGSHKKNSEVQAVVSEMVEDLVQRLPRMPFPPGTDELSFDFECTINHQRVLEEELTANTHELALLSAELDAEVSLLEQEKTQLLAVEKELSDLEESDEKEKRHLHPIAQEAVDKSRDIPAEYEMRSTIKKSQPIDFDFECDPEARDVLDQLRKHLDGMQNDSEGTTVSLALSTSQAALDVFNWRHLGEAEYYQVYGMSAT